MMPFNMSLVSTEFTQLVEQVSLPLSQVNLYLIVWYSVVMSILTEYKNLKVYQILANLCYLPCCFQAAVLMDRSSFKSYVCDNSSTPSWIDLACENGQVDRVFDLISQQKLIEQVKQQ